MKEFKVNNSIKDEVKKALTQDFKVVNSSYGRRIVLGWAAISHINNSRYYDSNKLWYSDECLLDAAIDYVKNSNDVQSEHSGDSIGTNIIYFPNVRKNM